MEDNLTTMHVTYPPPPPLKFIAKGQFNCRKKIRQLGNWTKLPMPYPLSRVRRTPGERLILTYLNWQFEAPIDNSSVESKW